MPNGMRTHTLTGDQLRRLRERAGVSQTQVAAYLAVVPHRVGNLEREARPTSEAAARVIAAIAELVRRRGRRR